SDATPTTADLVIGQPDFVSNAENLGQGGNGPGVALPDSLQFPGRVLVRGPDVYVADSGNSRVLHYTAPTANKPFADQVFGQFDDFTRRAKNNDGTGQNGCCPSADNLFNPIGIALDVDDRLYIADWNNHRILRLESPLTSDTTADAVFGQPDFVSNTIDNGGPANGLQLPIDLAFDGAGNLYVADSGNHRVLLFQDPLLDATADAVFGQLDTLSTDSPNHGLGFFMTDADGLFGPTGVGLDNSGNLVVVDTNNQRVLRFDMPIAMLGDLNCDGSFDTQDIDAFSLALTDPDTYNAIYCDLNRGDFNIDGQVNGHDIALFVSALISG
ncbi:MAG: NHL repeat-containing protein, partial [Phycisphaerae bacterium]